MNEVGFILNEVTRKILQNYQREEEMLSSRMDIWLVFS